MKELWFLRAKEIFTALVIETLEPLCRGCASVVMRHSQDVNFKFGPSSERTVSLTELPVSSSKEFSLNFVNINHKVHSSSFIVMWCVYACCTHIWVGDCIFPVCAVAIYLQKLCHMQQNLCSLTTQFLLPYSICPSFNFSCLCN